MSNQIIGPLLAGKLDSTDIAQGRGFSLGDRTEDAVGNEYVFVQAASACTAFDTVHISSTFQANPITAALAVTAGYLGFETPTALSTGDYAWVKTRGNMTVRLAQSCLPAVPLYTTDTAGVLDDATASASHHQVMGVLGVSSANNASSYPAVGTFPMIRRPAA